MTEPPERVADESRRLAVLVGAIAVMVPLVAIALVQGLDSVETIGLWLFAVVALASFWGPIPAIVAAVCSTALYAVLRRNALVFASNSVVNGLVIRRFIGYVFFGGVLGFLQSRLRWFSRVSDSKPSDVSTNVPRQSDAAIDNEVARARRYRRPLSALTIDLRNADVPERIFDVSKVGLRSSDVVDTTAHAMTIVLPETEMGEATVVAERIRLSAGVEVAVHDIGDADLDAASLRQRLLPS